ncbi:MAG: ClbS/DfsB family four-helix bundle protein, partial [Chloroflexi bacterium]|nr:ClbS/DfsB family four-helix bundle protein [Chloroflexota bacterium]
MNKSEILTALQSSRAAMLQALDGLSDSDRQQPGAVDQWSVKDVLAHLVRWEVELVTLLAQARQGKKPTYADFSPEKVDDVNAQWQRDDRDRPLEKILADFHGVRKQTIRQVESFSDDELTNPKLFQWLD